MPSVAMTVHANSLAAYRSLNLSERCATVLHVFVRTLQPMTDKECMARLGFKDPNAVRPRITDMVRCKVMEECGTANDAETGKAVRICRPAAFIVAHLTMAREDGQQQRRQVCMRIARVAEQGATSQELCRAFRDLSPGKIGDAIGRCAAAGCISRDAGERRREQVVWHITRTGLEKLDMPWPNHWHVDALEPVTVAPRLSRSRPGIL